MQLLTPVELCSQAAWIYRGAEKAKNAFLTGKPALSNPGAQA
jgi:hypothetical protein